MTTRPSLVVFDCDGTLVDSHGAIVRTVQRAFADEGLPVPTDDDVRERVGLSLHAFVADLIGNLPTERVESMIARYRELYVLDRDRRGAEDLFDGIRELLDSLLEHGVMMGVATGKSRRGLDTVLDAHGLRPHFVTTQTADDAPSKPHPAMVERAMDEAGVGPHETVMIGDSIHDIGCGRGAGVRTLGVTWGAHPAERLRAAGADAVLENVRGLAIALGVA